MIGIFHPDKPHNQANEIDETNEINQADEMNEKEAMRLIGYAEGIFKFCSDLLSEM